MYTHDRSAYLLQQIVGPIVGIYKSLTDTRVWKLGRSRAVSFLGTHKSDLLCSVLLLPPCCTCKVYSTLKHQNSLLSKRNQLFCSIFMTLRKYSKVILVEAVK